MGIGPPLLRRKVSGAASPRAPELLHAILDHPSAILVRLHLGPRDEALPGRSAVVLFSEVCSPKPSFAKRVAGVPGFHGVPFGGDSTNGLRAGVSLALDFIFALSSSVLPALCRLDLDLPRGSATLQREVVKWIPQPVHQLCLFPCTIPHWHFHEPCIIGFWGIALPWCASSNTPA